MTSPGGHKTGLSSFSLTNLSGIKVAPFFQHHLVCVIVCYVHFLTIENYYQCRPVEAPWWQNTDWFDLLTHLPATMTAWSRCVPAGGSRGARGQRMTPQSHSAVIESLSLCLKTA